MGVVREDPCGDLEESEYSTLFYRQQCLATDHGGRDPLRTPFRSFPSICLNKHKLSDLTFIEWPAKVE